MAEHCQEPVLRLIGRLGLCLLTTHLSKTIGQRGV